MRAPRRGRRRPVRRARRAACRPRRPGEVLLWTTTPRVPEPVAGRVEYPRWRQEHMSNAGPPAREMLPGEHILVQSTKGVVTLTNRRVQLQRNGANSRY